MFVYKTTLHSFYLMLVRGWQIFTWCRHTQKDGTSTLNDQRCFRVLQFKQNSFQSVLQIRIHFYGSGSELGSWIRIRIWIQAGSWILIRIQILNLDNTTGSLDEFIGLNCQRHWLSFIKSKILYIILINFASWHIDSGVKSWKCSVVDLDPDSESGYGFGRVN